MPTPADQTFLAGTEKVAGALSPLALRFFFPPINVRAFLLVETVQICYFSEAFERFGIQYGIGATTKAIRKRMRDLNKSESGQNAALSGGEKQDCALWFGEFF